MTRRCWCSDPAAVDPTLCFACGRAERPVPPWPPVNGDIWEQDEWGHEVLMAVDPAEQLEMSFRSVA